MTSQMSLQNQLLKELPSKALTRFRAECHVMQLTSGDVLLEAGERIRDVYFPTQSIVSLVAKTSDGATLEVLLVGDEGMIGLPLLFGADRKHFQVLVQKSGAALRMKAETFARMVNTGLALRTKLNEYAFSRLAQLGQNAICANAHQIEARLARRLLMMRDRSHSDQFYATQEALARMLGVRRSSVTIAAGMFQTAHFIEYNRGTITVLDRKGLERTSCACYWETSNGRHHSYHVD
jgi:CRP-like cAMP-binding protein